MRELCQKVMADRNDLIGLAANFRYLARQANVLILSVHAAKGVAGKRISGRVAPSHNDACIETARKRDPDFFLSIEVAGQPSCKCLAQMVVVAFRVKRLLFFPFAWLEVI